MAFTASTLKSVPALVRAMAVMAAALVLAGLGAGRAAAVPSFAVQTGLQCSACHVGGFGPQLTPVGRNFKLRAYTSRVKGFNLPFSAMAVASYVHTAQDQSEPPADHYGVNDNTTLDQASLFIAGGIGSHFGGFSQVTYDGIGRSFTWDNTDLRAVTDVSLHGSDALLGLSLNNNPGAQDSWNTLPAWGFPYTSSGLAPAPGTTPLINGAFAGNVIGLTGYALVNDRFYAEAGAYGSPSTGFLKSVGVDPAETSKIHGLAPYVRVAYQKNFGAQNFEVGAFGLWASLYPGRDESAGTTDVYRDLGVDGSYQLFSPNQLTEACMKISKDGGANTVLRQIKAALICAAGQARYAVNARYTHEQQRLRATQILGGAARVDNSLNDLRADVSYYWRNTIGLTLGAFDTWGSSDDLLFAGARRYRPDSNGATIQLDATPWGDGGSPFGPRINLRVGLQYTIYGSFDGASQNYDGLGHNASDNNTLRVFSWVAF